MFSQNGNSASSPARPMSHVTITTLRFQRSMSAPPSGANRKPGSMRATITKPTAVAEFEHAARDREDREEPDPVAEARHELRAEERKEARNAEHAPRRRRDRVAVGCRRDERRLVAHELAQPRRRRPQRTMVARPARSARRPWRRGFFAAFFAVFFVAFFVGLLRGLLRRLLRGLLRLLRRHLRARPQRARPLRATSARSGSVPRGTVAFTVPSVTYGP